MINREATYSIEIISIVKELALFLAAKVLNDTKAFKEIV